MRAGLGSGAELPPLSLPVHPMGSLSPVFVPKDFWGVGCHCHPGRMEGEPVNISLSSELYYSFYYCSKNISMGVFWLILFYFLSLSKERKTLVTACASVEGTVPHAQGLCPLSGYPLFAPFWPSGEAGAGTEEMPSLSCLEKRAFSDKFQWQQEQLTLPGGCWAPAYLA